MTEQKPMRALTMEEKLLIGEHRARAEQSKGKTVAITPGDLMRICDIAMRQVVSQRDD